MEIEGRLRLGLLYEHRGSHPILNGNSASEQQIVYRFEISIETRLMNRYEKVYRDEANSYSQCGRMEIER